ncbi:thermonuclease family protein [Sneathiella sp.]|uniref:thermonuclease family protein n=1 Tax=Sneathiella sp. TaxID=1964365 RepID=UPI003566665D
MRYFLIIMILGLVWAGGPGETAEAMLENLTAKNISNNFIIINGKAMVPLQGVRLVDRKFDAETFQASRRYLENELWGRHFTLEIGTAPDDPLAHNRYGDPLGKVIVDGKWLQKELIDKGYGWWSGAADYPEAARKILVNSEKEAEAHKQGLWRRFSVIDANHPRNSISRGDFIIAEGRIADVHHTAKVTYLNFGDNWQSDFTAAISSRNRKHFEALGWKLADLKNKLVRIRGIARFYNGPFLELDFPEQMEIKEVTGG